jgi:folate-binding protein YgfZ
MITDVRVFCTEDSFILSTEPAGREKLVPALRKYIIGDRPMLVNRSGEMGLLSLQGPKAGSVLANVFSQPLTLEHPYDHFEAVLAGARTRICRVNRTQAGGYDLRVEQQALPLIWDLILENGKGEVRPLGFESFDAQRIEAGIPWFGLDMDENTLPIEAGLEKSAISFNKGCYIGQESVARITYRGHVNRKLAGLKLSGSHAASRGDKISKDDHEVGWITSSRFSPGLNTAIALGYLRREVLEPGTVVVIEHGDERRNGQVAPLPFVEFEASGP